MLDEGPVIEPWIEQSKELHKLLGANKDEESFGSTL